MGGRRRVGAPKRPICALYYAWPILLVFGRGPASSTYYGSHARVRAVEAWRVWPCPQPPLSWSTPPFQYLGSSAVGYGRSACNLTAGPNSLIQHPPLPGSTKLAPLIATLHDRLKAAQVGLRVCVAEHVHIQDVCVEGAVGQGGGRRAARWGLGP